MWTYSSSSEVHLKRFLDSVHPPDKNNKWVKRFKINLENNIQSEENVYEESHNDVHEIVDSDLEVQLSRDHGEITSKHQNTEADTSQHADEIMLLELAETDLQEKFPQIHNTLLYSPHLLPKLAEKLTMNNIEKLSLKILEQSIDSAFIEIFYKDFLSVFLKREYTWVTLNILVIAYKRQPDFFRQYVFMEMLKNIANSNKILMSFVETLSLDDKLLFFTKILEVDLTQVEFLHNLSTILILYKDSKKSCYMQTCVEKMLVENSEHCAKETSFGKLLLVFLQHQTSFGGLADKEKFIKCFQMHQTPFKKPCLNIVKEMNLT